MCQRVLIVEDDELIRETLVLLLVDVGYKVRCCSTGKNIMTTVNDFQPDLILLDIILEELDGRDICKELKDDPETRHIPIIILSAIPEIYNSIIEFGANDVILKPFDERTLLNRIERQLLNSSSIRSS